MVAFFFLDEPVVDAAAFAKVIGGDPLGRAMLDEALGAFATVDWTAEALHEATSALGEGLGMALRKAQAPLRCAVTGSLVGPPLFESLHLLGRERTLARLRRAALVAAP